MMPQENASNPRVRSERSSFISTHLLWGVSGLFLYALLGVALELLLAYKVPALVDVENSERRLLLRLAHAHGTLLSLIQLGFAFVLSQKRPQTLGRRLRIASGALSAATLLIPGGFFLGGLDAQAGDPGLLVALVPAGAFLLLVGLGLTFWDLWTERRADEGGDAL